MLSEGDVDQVSSGSDETSSVEWTNTDERVDRDKEYVPPVHDDLCYSDNDFLDKDF